MITSTVLKLGALVLCLLQRGSGLSVQMSSYDANGSDAVAYLQGHEEVFKEDEIRQWVCHVKGARLRPTVTITIGDQDITDRFVKEEKVKRKKMADKYEVILTATALSIGYEFHGKSLGCEADIPGGLATRQAIHIKLSGYKPQFICSDTMIAEMDEPDVSIACPVRADPPVDDTKFLWDQDNMKYGKNPGHYKANVQQADDDTEIVMVLTIDKVMPGHFRIYRFYAANDLGNVTHEVELKRRYKAKAGSRGEMSSATGVTVSLVLIVLIDAVHCCVNL